MKDKPHFLPGVYSPGAPAEMPLPSRSGRPPFVWGSVAIDEDTVVVAISGWRKVIATKGRVELPVASVLRAVHDPAARTNVRTGLRRRRRGIGLWRLGVYHGLDGWSFWSIGLGRNAVLIESDEGRFRFVVVEVADPAATIRAIYRARSKHSSEPRGVVGPDTGSDCKA